MKYPLTLILGILGVLLFAPVVSFAATYPASCPVEAQGILGALGGCAGINESDYGAIYSKCCSAATTPDTPQGTDTTATTGTTDTTPKPTSLTAFYVQPTVANIRACAGITCRVAGQLPQNTMFELPYGTRSALPEWVEIDLDGSSGYISKTVLSTKRAVAENSSSVIDTTVTIETPEDPETPDTPPEETPPETRERAMPKILLITGVLMWLAAFLAFVIKRIFKFYLYLERKFPGLILPQRVYNFLVEHDPRWSGFLHQLIKSFLTWGLIAIVVGISTM
ncbi:MAG: hypothetical protein Q7S52_01230 [bacterium]|nr:hypothetical protein [bacterium]